MSSTLLTSHEFNGALKNVQPINIALMFVTVSGIVLGSSLKCIWSLNAFCKLTNLCPRFPKETTCVKDIRIPIVCVISYPSNPYILIPIPNILMSHMVGLYSSSLLTSYVCDFILCVIVPSPQLT